MVNKSQDNPEVFGKKVVFKMSKRIKRRAEMTLAYKNSKSKVEENPLPQLLTLGKVASKEQDGSRVFTNEEQTTS